MPDIRYIGKFGSKDGQVYQVRLRDSTFDGDPTEFPLASVRFLRGRRGTHQSTPIRGSSIELVGWKLSPTDLSVLLAAPVGRFTTEIWRGASHAILDGGGGEFYWKGITQTDLGEDDTLSIVSEVSIKSTGGLALLRDIDYYDGESPYTGRETHLETIMEILSKIGYSVPISVSAKWIPSAGEEGDILWEHAEADQSRFYDDRGLPLKCYEVLKQILYLYQGIMFWREGRYVILQKDQLGASTYTTNDYDANGDPDGTTEWGNVVDVSTGDRLAGKRIFRAAYGSARVSYNHGNIPNLVQASDFQDTPFLAATDVWEFGSNGGEIRTAGIVRTTPAQGLYGQLQGVGSFVAGLTGRAQFDKVGFVPAFFYGTDPDFSVFQTAIQASDRYAYQTCLEIVAGQRLVLALRFRIPYNEGGGNGLYNTFWSLQIGDNADGWMTAGGTWFAPAGNGFLQPVRPWSAHDDFNDAGVPLDRSEGTWREVVITSLAAPYSGEVKLWLYGTADINGSNLEPQGVEWGEVGILIVDEDGELRDTTNYDAVTPYPEPADDELVLLIGQGPTPNMPSRITWDGEYAGDWTDGEGEGEGEDIGRLLVRKRLGYQSNRLETRFETYAGLFFEMGDVLQIGADLYDVPFHEKDLASQEDTFEAVRLLFDDSEISFSELSEDRGAYFPGSSGGATSVDAGSGTQLPIQVKGDLIIGDGEGLPTRFPSGEDDGKMMVTDGESDTGWSLQDVPELDLPIIAAGDLIVGDGEGEASRLPAAGEDDYVLTFDTAEEKKMRWASPAASFEIAAGIVTLSPGDGTKTVTPEGISTSLEIASITLTLRGVPTSDEYSPAVENITETTFDITAQADPSESYDVQWLVIGNVLEETGVTPLYVYYTTAPGSDGELRRIIL